MDEIDFGISMMLVVNSRIPYRELANIFNMSVNSIHKRIKSLVDIGIIQNFNTKLSHRNFSNPIDAIFYGNSTIENTAGLLEKLGEHECIYNVTQASDRLYYIYALLKDFHGLEPLVSFLKKTGRIPDLEIGLVSTIPTPNSPESAGGDQNSWSSEIEELNSIKLSKLDYLIINALKNNSRKPISDIADEVGASTKTVRRRLDGLIEKYLVDFSIDWYPDKAPIIISIIILKLNPNTEVDKARLMEDLRKEYGQTILFLWSFSNQPNLMMVCVWSSSMKKLHELETSLNSRNFDSVKVTILINGKMFPTWREQFLEDQIKKIEDTGIKNS
ncbi:MAG: winged helix-turn-helix transcriptional regulator [Promethearchaeota archaeon]|jgi:DNA-binding Lrp family transcriptional regulator